jgi:hypothetical protein
MGTEAPLELTRWQLAEHHGSSNEENMAWLNPSFFSKKMLEGEQSQDEPTPQPDPYYMQGLEGSDS